MNKDKYFSDMYVHLHPDRSFEDKEKLERVLCESSGVYSVHFDKDEHRNAMFVAYNPEAVSPDALLEIIKKFYTSAVSVAGMLTRVSDRTVTMNNK